MIQLGRRVVVKIVEIIKRHRPRHCLVDWLAAPFFLGPQTRQCSMYKLMEFMENRLPAPFLGVGYFKIASKI
jgi:hypothetical protein